MATEKLNTQVRKEQIAQAAMELVAAGGLMKLSVAAVARRVGLVPSALYRHFKGKDDVLDAALGLIQDKLLGNVKTVREKTDNALTQLHDLLMRHSARTAASRRSSSLRTSTSIAQTGGAGCTGASAAIWRR